MTPAMILAAGALCVGAMIGPIAARSVSEEASAMQRGSRSEPGRGIINPADQRNMIIDELRRLNARIESLEKSLDGPIEVEVVSMPRGGGEGD